MKLSNLTLTKAYLNPYEQAYDRYKSNRFFTEEDWATALENGTLDQYVDALSKSDNILISDLNNKYNYQFSTQDTKLNALYNEIYADRTVKDREIDEYDANGKIVGKKTIQISDYDYFKEAIKYQNNINMSKYYEEQARIQKESMDGFSKFANWLGSATTTLLGGVAKGVDNIVEFFGAIFEGTVNSISNGTDWFENVGAVLASDRYEFGKGLRDYITQYEMQYGWRDPITGNYNSDVNTVIAGAIDTIGMMIPSAALGNLAGHSLGTGANLLQSATINATAQKVIGKGIFYITSEFAQSYERSYEYAKENNLDVSYSHLMLTDALSAAAKWAIDMVTDKFLGGTALDTLMYGIPGKSRTIGKINSLFVRGIFNLAGDALREGVEEVLQDITDALVHDMMGADYAGLSTLNAEDLVLTFITAALAGVMGSTASVLSTERQTIVKNGKVVKLSKISSRMLALDFATMQQHVDEVIKFATKQGDIGYSKDLNFKAYSKAATTYQKAFKNIYTSAKVIGSIFGKIGDTRVNNIMSAMTRINNAINAGKFDNAQVIRDTRKLAAEILGDETSSNIIEASFKELSDELYQAGLSDIVAKIQRGDIVSNLNNLTKEQQQKIDEVLKKDKNIRKIILTANGHDVVTNDDASTICVQKDVLNNVNDLLKFVAGKKLIKAIKNNSKMERLLPNIVKLYEKYSGITDVSTDNVISALLQDREFFKTVLFAANQDAYEILSHLASMANASIDKTVTDVEYIKLINLAKTNMNNALVEYLIYQVNADINIVPSDILSNNDVALIRRKRYGNDLRTRAINDITKLSDNEVKFIKNKINALPIQQSIKTRLSTNIFSDNFTERYNAWSALDKEYKNIFSTDYDGITYMPNNSVPNHTFNAWLKSNKLTISNMLTKQLTDSEVSSMLTTYGNTNVESILLFRQSQFKQFCHEKYTFKLNDKGKVEIYNEDNNQVGWSTHISSINNFRDSKLSSKKLVLTDRVNRKFIEKYINQEIDDISRAAITINDLITDSSLLTENAKNDIINKYKSLNPNAIYNYLKDNMLKDTNGRATVTILANGTYALAEVTKMKGIASSAKDLTDAIKTLSTTGSVAASKFIKKEYLPESLKNVFFVLSSKDPTSTHYLPSEVGGRAMTNSNSIIVSSKYVSNIEHLTYVVLHEYAHKLQEYNAMNLGFNPRHFAELYDNKKLKVEDAKRLVEDVKKHAPEVFSKVDYKMYADQASVAQRFGIKSKNAALSAELAAVGEFIYYTCGEVNAYGLETEVALIDYPTVVNKNEIILPWGTRYNYSTAAVMDFNVKKLNDGSIIRTDIGTYVGEDYNFSNVSKFDNFLELFKYDPAYEEAMQLYHYLKNKSTDKHTFFADYNYRNMYMENYPKWAKMYEDKYAEFTSLKSNLAIAAYLSIEMNNTTDVNNGKQIKDNLLASITDSDRRTSLELLKTQIAPLSSYEEFLNMDLPYVRVQQNDTLYDTDFVSISVGSFATASFAKVLYEDLFSKGYSYAYVGTIKPSQLLMYLEPTLFEAIVKPEELIGSERYLVDIREDGIYVLDDYTQKTENILSKEAITSAAEIERESYFALSKDTPAMHEFNGPRPPKYADENLYEEINEEEIKLPKRSKANYKHRRAFKSLKSGKVYYQYYGQKEVKKRQISYKLAGQSNLKYFANRRISPELQTFIANATKENSGKYYNKILDGSLTQQEVLQDFREGKITDQKVFELVNKAFFKNDNIKTPQDLEKLVENSNVYWSARRFLKQYGFNNDKLRDLTLDTLDSLLKIIITDTSTMNVFTKLTSGYSELSTKKTIRDLNIDEAYLRMLYMKRFDGSLMKAKEVASVARSMAILGYVSSNIRDASQVATSLDKQDETGRTVSDRVADDRTDLLTMVEENREEMIQTIATAKLTELYEKYGDKMRGEYKTVLTQKYKEWLKKINDLSDGQILSKWSKIVNNTEKYTKSQAIQSKVIAKAEKDLTVEKSIEGEVIDAIIAKTKADTKNVVRGIQHQVSTIRRNLKQKDIKRFLEDNSDIFTNELKLKDEVLHDKDKSGRLIYKPREIIDAVKTRISKLSKDVQGQVYASKKAFNYAKRLEKEVSKLKRKIATAVKEGSSKNNYKSITITEQDRTLTIDTSKPVPEKLVPLLNYVLKKQADTNVQYLSSENEKHVEVSLKNFIKDNADYLATLTQNDIDDIVDFYMTSDVIPSTNDASKYTAIQVMLLTYITKGARDGLYVFDPGVLTDLENRLKTIVSTSSIVMNAWQTALPMLRPAEQLVSNFYTQYGVNVTTEQLNRINNAYRLHDPKILTQVRKEIYDDMIEKNSRKYIKAAEKRMTDEEKALTQVGIDIEKTGKTSANTDIITTKRSLKKRVDSFLSKVWNIERSFMLSSPGTAIRNWVSNNLIGGVYIKDKQILPGLNTISGKIGNFIVNKILPKKWQKENQWQIAGTKVSTEAQMFIKTNLIDSGLLSMISDSLSKYDVRRLNKTASISDVFAELITRKLAQDVFNNNHKITAFFSKWLSDDKAVNRAAIKYFGKLLTEDNTKLTDDYGNMLTTMSQRTTELFVEAYLLAADDFMHKTNFMHKIEETIKIYGGDTAYFVWKQFMPFASSAVNWYVESLRYTPFGLIKSIINFAKLESKIEKLDKARARGDRAISSKFAQYTAARNIGKGVIGTTGMLIGIALAVLGAVRLSEEDNKYKLAVGSVSVDISEIFGTQGILLGMGIAQGIRDSKSFWNIVKDTTNTLFEDSLYTSILNIFKYGGDDVASNLENYFTYTVPNMFVPNFLKTLSSVTRKYDVKYSSGILGKLEKLVVNAIPFIDRAFPSSVDIYTGNASAKYTFSDYFVDVLNKLGVAKFEVYNMSATEELAISLGINKSELTGRYTVNNERINLTSAQVSAINQLYGKLNKKDLEDFTNNRKTYKVENEKGKVVTLKYSQMTDKQKATVINRIMDNNSSIAKIYALTKLGYKYYATDTEFYQLRKLGITQNVYKKTDKLQGFVKIK